MAKRLTLADVDIQIADLDAAVSRLETVAHAEVVDLAAAVKAEADFRRLDTGELRRILGEVRTGFQIDIANIHERVCALENADTASREGLATLGRRLRWLLRGK